MVKPGLCLLGIWNDLVNASKMKFVKCVVFLWLEAAVDSKKAEWNVRKNGIVG